jgi:hypothetical protein
METGKGKKEKNKEKGDKEGIKKRKAKERQDDSWPMRM